jgi:hypothetical protein
MADSMTLRDCTPRQVVACALRSEQAPGRVLTNPLVKHVGVVSYGIYLMHILLLKRHAPTSAGIRWTSRVRRDAPLSIAPRPLAIASSNRRFCAGKTRLPSGLLISWN